MVGKKIIRGKNFALEISVCFRFYGHEKTRHEALLKKIKGKTQVFELFSKKMLNWDQKMTSALEFLLSRGILIKF